MKRIPPPWVLKSQVIIFLFSSFGLAAQNQNADLVESKFFQNAIYGSLGVNLEAVGEAWFTGTAYYERMLKGRAQNSNISTFVKGGFGVAAYWEDSSPYILGQYGILTGKKAHHFEVSAGLVLSLMEDFDIFPISGSMGYRIQKPGGHFIFRTGVAWPEALYFGFGVSFGSGKQK